MGKTIIDFEINGTHFSREVFVIDGIQFSDIILGIDFLTDYKVHIDFENRKVIGKDYNGRPLTMSQHISSSKPNMLTQDPDSRRSFLYQDIDTSISNEPSVPPESNNEVRDCINESSKVQQEICQSDIKKTKRGTIVGKQTSVLNVAKNLGEVSLPTGEPPIDKLVIKEYLGDLFDAPEDFSLVHCISKDWQSKGLAKRFRDK
ncbi:Hypothetical predicted protein, partial [Olea europaea subsp. europaea]